MKQLCILLAVLLASTISIAQTTDYYAWIGKRDLSKVIFPKKIGDFGGTSFTRNEPLGFIGTEKQRFYIHFSTIEQSVTNPYRYNLAGKTRVNDNICSFAGQLLITNCYSETGGFGVDTTIMVRQLFVTATLLLHEDSTQNGSGTISGTLNTHLFIDHNNKLQYNALDFSYSDGYNNNQFAGTWKSHTSGITKPCNWGDYRIPGSGGLDTGAGEFSPAIPYIRYGWQNYYQLFNSDAGTRKKAQQKEAEKWWK